METITYGLLAAAALFFSWRMFKALKANPELLSRKNVSDSLTTFGILALLLIGFVALLLAMVSG